MALEGPLPDGIVPHDITLKGEKVVLRPLTEDDWPFLAKWGRDPEVLWFTEGDDVAEYSLEDIQGIFRSVSRTAFCFVIEHGGRPIGEGWLQRMNIKAISDRHPGMDLRRIDLSIGEKELWGKGLGGEAIALLTRFGFEGEKADAIFGLVGGQNRRSVRAFMGQGYAVSRVTEEPYPATKSRFHYELVLWRGDWKGAPGTRV